MSASIDLQEAVQGILSQSGVLSVALPIIARRTQSLERDIEAAGSLQAGLCVWVLPARPLRALQSGQDFVAISNAELRVQILEQPILNPSGPDCFELWDEIAIALQGEPQRTISRAAQALATARSIDLAAALALLRAGPAYPAHFQLLDMLSFPLQLAENCAYFDNITGEKDTLIAGKQILVHDVIFETKYEFQQPQ